MKSLILAGLMVAGLFAQTAPTTGRVRILHASPDAPAVDILVDGNVAIEGLPYKEYTEYLPLPAGPHDIRVNVTGTSTTVLRANPTVAAGTDYTAIAVGFAGGRMPALDLLLLTDNNVVPMGENIKLRVVHAAASAPGVDVYLTTPFEPISTRQPGLSNVPFKGVSPYITVPALMYHARVTVAGTKTVAISSGRLPTWPSIIRTVVAVDATGGGGPFEFLMLPDRN
jgi:hypothetical protein